MKKIDLKSGDTTPSVLLDKELAIMEIRGYSFPDEAYAFYAQILAWFREYAGDPNPSTKVVFDFKYVNSTSTKSINDILKILDRLAASGKNVCVEWLFEADDEDIQQTGITLKEINNLSFLVLVKKVK